MAYSPCETSPEAGEEKTATEVRDRDSFVNQQGTARVDLLAMPPLAMQSRPDNRALTIKQEKPFRISRKGLQNFSTQGDYSELPPVFGGT